MRASCVRREGKGRRPVGLESRELLLPRDPSPVSFFRLDSLPAQSNANATQNLCLNFNQDERERKALLDKFLGEVQNRVSGRA